MRKQSLYFIQIWQEDELKMLIIQLNTKLGGEARVMCQPHGFSTKKNISMQQRIKIRILPSKKKIR
jgi:hypothetical protein